jgi:predicted MFS family arabinose efflux permease
VQGPENDQNHRWEAVEEARFGLLYATPIVAYADRFAIPPILVAIARGFDVTVGAATTVATLYFFLYGVMQPVYGVLADRLGRVRVMRVALLGMGIANMCAALAPSLGALAAAKALTASFAAAIFPLSLVYVGDKVPFDRRQRVVANVLAAGATGTVVATLGGGLLGRFDKWRLVFVIAAAMAFLLAVLLRRLPESLSVERGEGPWVQIRRVLGHGWAVFLYVVALAEGAAMLGFLTFLAPALEAHGESAAVAGSVVAVYGVAVFCGMQILKRALRATAPPPVLIVCGGALLVIAYLVAALSQAVGNVLVASLLIGLAFAFLHSTLQTWATEVVPEARATATTLFVTCVFTGAALGTAAVSRLASAERYDALFLVAAAVTLPVAVVASLGRARYQPSQ